MEERLHSRPTGRPKRNLGGAHPWRRIIIVLLACLSVSTRWNAKPPHFDEGCQRDVRRWADGDGYYHYDPTTFTGPLHFYLLFLAQTLFWAPLWALAPAVAPVQTSRRWSLALAYRPVSRSPGGGVGRHGLALSPAMVFYGRYASMKASCSFF